MHEFQEKSINTISFKLDLKSCMSGPVKRHVTTLRLPDHYKYTVQVFSRFQTSHPLDFRNSSCSTSMEHFFI